MSVGLVREVIERAPREISAAEYVVLLMIAEKAQEKPHDERGRVVRARECFPSREDLARDCHQTTVALEKILQRLARRGLEVRVPIGTDKHGKPYFARAGVRTTYRLPLFPARADRIPGSPSSGPADGVQDATAGRTGFGPEGGQDSGHERTGFRAKPGQDSGPNQNVTVREPEREPSAPSERGQLASTDPLTTDDVIGLDDTDGLLEVIDQRLHGLDDFEYSKALGMATKHPGGITVEALVHQVVNKIQADRVRAAAA